MRRRAAALITAFGLLAGLAACAASPNGEGSRFGGVYGGIQGGGAAGR